MAWSPEVPPPPVRPVVTGWFAIFNVVSLQTVSMTTLGNVIGMMAALQTMSPTNAAASKGVQRALQSMAVTNAGQVSAPRIAAQSFSITDSAILRAAPIAAQSLTLTQLATVVAVGNALQTTPITNAAVAKGLQTAAQSAVMGDSASVVGPRVAADTMTIIDGATVRGHPTAPSTLTLSGSGTPVGVILAPEQLVLLNVGNITGFEGSLSGNQTIPIIDAATTKGVQAGAASFTLVNGASLVGNQAGAQLLTVTDAGVTKGVEAASVSFTITNAGAVYARITAVQSGAGMSNAASVYQVSTSGIAYDTSAASTFYSVVNSPSPTYTHTHAANAFAIVHITFGYGFNSMQTPGRGGYVPTVTFGGIPLKYKGYIDQNNADFGGQAVFAGNVSSLGAATSTVLVTGMQAGRPFSGQVTSYTYTGAKSCGSLVTSYGAPGTASLAVSSPKTDDVVFCAVSKADSAGITAPSFTSRQNLSGNDSYSTIAGDISGDPSVTVSATVTGAGWSALALNLYTEPVVEFNAITYTAVNWGDTVASSHTAPANALIVVDVTSGGGGSAALPPTYGGVAMTLVAVMGWTSRYAYVDTAGGTKTASYSIPTFGAGSIVVRSYTNASGTYHISTTAGAGQAASHSAVVGENEIACHIFGAKNGSASGAYFTSPAGGIVRANFQDGNRVGMCAMDSDSSTTFTATGNPSYYSGWDSILSIISTASEAQALSVGVGLVSTNVNATTGNWNHTIESDASALVVAVATGQGAGNGTPLSVTCNSQAMILLDRYDQTFGTFIYSVAVYGMLAPPTGSQNVVVNLNAGNRFVANSFTYKGVLGFGNALNRNTGSSAAASLTVPASHGEKVFNLIAVRTGSTPSAYTKTLKFSNTAATGLVMTQFGDADGDTSVSFGATISPSTNWLTVGVRLLPTPQVLFNATSGAMSGGGGFNLSGNITTTGISTVLCFVTAQNDPSPPAPTLDGAAMTLHSTNGHTLCYVMTGVTAGAHALQVSYGVGGYRTGIAMAYNYVTTIGAALTTAGTGTAMSHGPITVPSGQVIVQSFGAWSASTSTVQMSALSGGNDRGYNNTLYTASSGRDSFVTATFAGTRNAAATNWESIAVPLS